jgi:hypothetical protein
MPPALAIVKRNNKASPGVSIPGGGPSSSDVFQPLSAPQRLTRTLGPLLFGANGLLINFSKVSKTEQRWNFEMLHAAPITGPVTVPNR